MHAQVFLPAGAPPLPVANIPHQLCQPVSHLGEREQLLHPGCLHAPRSVQEPAAVGGAVHQHGPARLLQDGLLAAARSSSLHPLLWRSYHAKQLSSC